MPKYKVDDSLTGKSYIFEGDSPPTQDEIASYLGQQDNSTPTGISGTPLGMNGMQVAGMTIPIGKRGSMRLTNPQTKQNAKIPPRQVELLQDTLQVITGYKDLSKRMESGKFKTGVLSPRFYPGVKGDLPMQLVGSPEEATFKADTDKYFQKYRKVTTGVQAGYPELQWLAADYPKTTDRPDIYQSKAKAAVDTNIENAKNMLSTLENAGYNVDKFKKQLEGLSLIQDKYVKTGTRNGKKVGMLPDGTIEEINGK